MTPVPSHLEVETAHGSIEEVYHEWGVVGRSVAGIIHALGGCVRGRPPVPIELPRTLCSGTSVGSVPGQHA